jgi:hypothetical protein
VSPLHIQAVYRAVCQVLCHHVCPPHNPLQTLLPCPLHNLLNSLC